MIIDPNNQSKLPNMPNMVKRGFNQTPDDIRDRIVANKLAFKKQEQIQKTKETISEPLSKESKVEGLNKLNNRF